MSKTLSDGPWDQKYPLHNGAREGILDDVVKFIEVKNFSPDKPDGEFLKTPLMFACLHRRYVIVDYLLRRSDVHVENCTSTLWSPLMMAVREGDLDVAQLILEGPQANRVEINGKNHLGQTALHIAVLFTPRAARLGLLQLLMAHGANPNLQDSFGKSAIRCATFSSQAALANYLIAKTPVPVPQRAQDAKGSRLCYQLSEKRKPVYRWGEPPALLVPNKWAFSGEGQGGDSRPPIATRRLLYRGSQARPPKGSFVKEPG